MRFTIGMALHAVAEFGNARLDVRDAIFLGVMGMTVVAGVLGIRLGMTGRTSDFAFAPVIDRERVLLQLGRRPGLNGMTRRAIGTEHAFMDFRISMARCALGFGLREITGFMALSAFDLRVATR